MTSSRVVVIIPMKVLESVKSRLSPELSDLQRRAMGLNLLRRVLRAAVDSSVQAVWVVGVDSDVGNVALDEGAEWIQEDGANLNETLWMAFQKAFQKDMAACYLPGDLPFLKPQDVKGMVEASDLLQKVVLSPCHCRGGTNSILVSQGTLLKPMLGRDSFRAHIKQAKALKLPFEIYESVGLSLDLDTAEDLHAYELLEHGLMDELTVLN